MVPEKTYPKFDPCCVEISEFPLSPQINCYLKGEAGEERKLDGATTGWKGEGCESPRRKEKGPAETGLLDNEGQRSHGGRYSTDLALLCLPEYPTQKRTPLLHKTVHLCSICRRSSFKDRSYV